MSQQVDPLLQGNRPREILGSVGNEIPVPARTVAFFLVNAEHAIALCLEISNRINPATGIVPVLRLACGLGRDAHIGLLDGALFGRGQDRTPFHHIQPQNIGNIALQADDAEIRGLMHGRR